MFYHYVFAAAGVLTSAIAAGTDTTLLLQTEAQLESNKPAPAILLGAGTVQKDAASQRSASAAQHMTIAEIKAGRAQKKSARFEYRLQRKQLKEAELDARRQLQRELKDETARKWHEGEAKAAKENDGKMQQAAAERAAVKKVERDAKNKLKQDARELLQEQKIKVQAGAARKAAAQELKKDAKAKKLQAEVEAKKINGVKGPKAGLAEERTRAAAKEEEEKKAEEEKTKMEKAAKEEKKLSRAKAKDEQKAEKANAKAKVVAEHEEQEEARAMAKVKMPWPDNGEVRKPRRIEQAILRGSSKTEEEKKAAKADRGMGPEELQARLQEQEAQKAATAGERMGPEELQARIQAAQTPLDAIKEVLKASPKDKLLAEARAQLQKRR